MTIVIIIIITATNIPTTLDQDFQKALKATSARATHKARTNICTIEMFNGPILNVIPASSPLLIFFGYTTFIKIKNNNVKIISFYWRIV